MTLAQDAAAMMRGEMSVSVQTATHRTRGVLDDTLTNEMDPSGAARQVRRRVLMVAAGAIGVPARDSVITIDGTPYRCVEQAGDMGEVDGALEFWRVAGA